MRKLEIHHYSFEIDDICHVNLKLTSTYPGQVPDKFWLRLPVKDFKVFVAWLSAEAKNLKER